MVRACLSVAIGICVMLSAGLANGAVDARVGRTTFPVTDSVRVVFETDQDVDDSPDFSPLAGDFEILGTSQSTSVNIINGRMKRAATWNVDLMAKRQGKLIIPALRIGNEITRPITLTVTAAATGADGVPVSDVFLEVDVDHAEPYVQGQFILTIRLLRRVQFGNASLTEPTVRGGDVVSERLGDDVSYETQRGGATLGVIERRYAMFAQQSGPLIIEPLLFEGRAGGRSTTVFDPFGRGRVIRARSEPVALDVQPIPPDFSGRTWLPARNLLLVESMPDANPMFRVGEPVTRTLTLRADGLASAQLPELRARVPDGIRQYPDQPILENRAAAEGLTGIRQEKVALIPSQAGTLTLPAVEIPWWNTRTDQLEYARLPERTVEVAPADGVTVAETPLLETVPVAAGGSLIGLPGETAPLMYDRRWQWISAGLGAGWFVTLVLWFWSRRRRSTPREESVRPSRRQLVAAVKKACSAGDAAAAKDALLNWAAWQWPGSQIRSLGDLAARLDGDLQQCVHDLSQSLYSGTPYSWDGTATWSAFVARRRTPKAQPGTTDPELEPLYLR
jgi:hypothetical protein